MINNICSYNYSEGIIVIQDESDFTSEGYTRADYSVVQSLSWINGDSEEKDVPLSDSFDPLLSLTNNTVDIVGDGYYELTTTITNQVTKESEVFTKYIIICDGIENCYNNLLKDLKASICSTELSEKSKEIDSLTKLKLLIECIRDSKDSGNPSPHIPCLIESAFSFCENQNCKCGC